MIPSHANAACILVLLAGCSGTGGSKTNEPMLSPPAGWGAVFWKEGAAWQIGGGDVVVGPDGAARIEAQGPVGLCGGRRIDGAPPHAVVALPAGSAVPSVTRPPAIPAAKVERAAWRLGEVLPATPFAPSMGLAPAKQHGVKVGSVVKTRRNMAPPVLLVSGVRECSAAVAVTDADAGKVLASDVVAGPCDRWHLLPPLDLWRDGRLEIVAFNDTWTILYRLSDTGRTLKLERLGGWHCAEARRTKAEAADYARPQVKVGTDLKVRAVNKGADLDAIEPNAGEAATGAKATKTK